ncbi:MAG TPA: AlkA N-terminal domain-containing protein [Candidatus Angelobacter sp.]|nr:AlkA N-terminal domain-containing protein [Candidatus Angelobacter sp.]
MASKHSFAVPVHQPFDWESLLAFLRLRATPGVESVTESAYIRTACSRSRLQAVSVRYHQEKSLLHVDYTGDSADQAELEQRVRHLFKPEVNTSAIEEFLSRDPWLRGFVRQRPGLRVPGGWCGFEVAIRAVLGQQISVAAATTLMGRLVRLAGSKAGEGEWLFPTPMQVCSADLSCMGIPGKRRETVKALAAFFAEQDERCLLQPDAVERLLQIGGIGRWTAGYILMRSSADSDQWPEGDLVLRKALGAADNMLSHSELAARFSRWSPYRSYATIHIWRGYASSTNAAAPDARDRRSN